jgi:hypothetical protein
MCPPLDSSTDSSAGPPWRISFTSLASLIAVLLLAAALAKIYQVSTEVIELEAMTGTEYRMVVWLAAELALALWLLSGRWPQTVRVMTLLAFVSFAVSMGHKGSSESRPVDASAESR